MFLRNVQCRPFHPCEQTHVPFLHCPCSAQRKSHVNWSHKLPVQPELHRHRPDSQTPFGPQSKLQTAGNISQGWLIYINYFQLNVWEENAGRKWGFVNSACISIGVGKMDKNLPCEQSKPVQWRSQTHCPVSRSYCPWSEQPGRHWYTCWSTALQSSPCQPALQ